MKKVHFEKTSHIFPWTFKQVWDSDKALYRSVFGICLIKSKCSLINGNEKVQKYQKSRKKFHPKTYNKNRKIVGLICFLNSNPLISNQILY